MTVSPNSSQVEIINNALSVLGQRPITALSTTEINNNQTLRDIYNQWDNSVREAFQKYDWQKFTTMRQLSAVTNTDTASSPVSATDHWNYTFNLPANFFSMIYVAGTTDRNDLPIEYEIIDGYVCTNYQQTFCWFINGTYANQVGTWPQAFCNYVAMLLASKGAASIDAPDTKFQFILREGDRYLQDAKRFDARLNPYKKQTASRANNSRFATLGGTYSNTGNY